MNNALLNYQVSVNQKHLGYIMGIMITMGVLFLTVTIGDDMLWLIRSLKIVTKLKLLSLLLN